MWLPIYPAPPVTRTVMLGARSYCEIVAFAHRNMAQNNRFECPLLTPQNKRWDLRQHRQHRLHEQCLFSDPSKVGVITSRPMTAGSTDNADGTDGVFGARAHPDHSCPGAAFTRERDLDAQRPEERLRPPQSTGERPRIFCPCCAARD